MSRWHRENPDYAERGWSPPDWRDAADRLRKERRENPNAIQDARGLYPCVVCGENVPRYGSTCERCRKSIDEDRLNRGD